MIARLRSPSRLGITRGRLSRAGGSLPTSDSIPRPDPLGPRGWRLTWLLAGLIGLTTLALVLFAAPDPDPPATPAASTPATPHIGNPDIAAPSVPFGAPNITPPGLSLPSLSLPDVGGSSSDDRARPERRGPERRTVWIHDHHRLYLWQIDGLLILLALVGLVALYPFARMPRRGQRRLGALAAAGFGALAIAAFAAGIDPQSGPGSYEREPPEVERSRGFLGLGPETVVRRVHTHHYHPPVTLAAH